MDNIGLDQLRSELDEFAEPKRRADARHERIIAGFEERPSRCSST